MARDKTGATIRAEAAKVVDAVVSGGRSLEAALADACRFAKPQDTALLSQLCYGTLRHHWRLQAWQDSLLQRPLRSRDSLIRSLISIGLYQLDNLRVPDHAAVSTTVEAARLLRLPKFAGLVNAVLRNFRRRGLGELEPTGDEARFDHPGWLIEAIRADWPDDWRQILEANNERAPMWLRVNSRRLSAPAYLERLDDDGALSHALLPGVDGAVRLARPRPVDELPGFLDGDVSVQDAAAQLAAPWLAVGGARRILDACAAPGGKTGHLLELADRAVSLYAVDSDATRLAAVGENLARLGVSATLIAADASNPEQWWDGQPFDRILLDAPCSASGVIRRHPDIKLLRRPSDIGKLAGLQQQLLQAVWPLLAPGGRLLYVTCSVLARENDRIVAGFMRHTGDARENRVLPNNNIRDLMLAKGCGYQILPGVRGLDGFYFACLDKVS